MKPLKHGVGPVTLLCALVWCSATWAQESAGQGYWYGGEAGASAVTRTSTSSSSRVQSTRFSMAFRGGVAISPQLLLGGELGGFLIEAGNFNDPSRGRGISQVFAVAQYHGQSGREGLYGRVGMGYSSYWGNHADDKHRSGSGGSIAIGYDSVSKVWGAFGPVLTFGGGRLGDERYRAVSIGLNWSAR